MFVSRFFCIIIIDCPQLKTRPRKPLRNLVGRIRFLIVYFLKPPVLLIDQLLAFFRERQLSPVALKAVLTPVNCHWNSLKLHEELLKERDAMRR